MAAAVAVIPVILVEQSDARRSARHAASIANWVIRGLFATEAVVMLGASHDRGRSARHHKLELAARPGRANSRGLALANSHPAAGPLAFLTLQNGGYWKHLPADEQAVGA
jgi:hypothetical protein